MTHDRQRHEGSIPFPATFSIELADALTDPEAGVTTRLYSDFPFTFRKDGGPRDEFEGLALTKMRFAEDKEEPIISFEEVNGRRSLRYGRAIVMKQSCVDCHNVHPASPKKDWKVGDVRGVRMVTLPLDAGDKTARGGWLVTLLAMLSLTTVGLGLIFLVTSALRASIDLLSKTNTAYNRFVPHEFLAYLQKESIVDVQLNDNIEKQMTILFSDIRSFTNLSERMSPGETFVFVNNYLSLMGPIVRRNNGFIDKYIGDAIMALFESSDDALNASMEMLEALRAYNESRSEEIDASPIRIGIGLHRGTLRLGTVGEADRMDGTVISDAVNLASRMEGLTKFYGVQCLLSESTRVDLNDIDKYPTRFIDTVKVKGKSEAVTIYEAFSGDDHEQVARKLAVQDRFKEAVGLYRVKEFERAAELFRSVLSDLPEDVATRSHLERCERYRQDGTDDDWDGTLSFEIK